MGSTSAGGHSYILNIPVYSAHGCQRCPLLQHLSDITELIYELLPRSKRAKKQTKTLNRFARKENEKQTRLTVEGGAKRTDHLGAEHSAA